MIWNRRNPFLCDTAAELTTGGGGAPGAQAPGAAPAAPVTPGAPPTGPPPIPTPAAVAPGVAPVEPPPREMTLLEKAKLAIADKSVIITRAETAEASLATVTAQLGQSQAEVTRLSGLLATAQGQVAQLTAERTELSNTLSGVQSQVKSTEAAAANIIATQMGVNPAALPAPAQEGSSIEALYAKLDKETDPQEIMRISRKIDAEEAKAKRAEEGAV